MFDLTYFTLNALPDAIIKGSVSPLCLEPRASYVRQLDKPLHQITDNIKQMLKSRYTVLNQFSKPTNCIFL